MGSSETFDRLVVGLAEFLRRDTRYPYPDLLRHALNTLALEMTTVSYPRTLNGLLALLEKPVRTWYPRSLLPREFDPDFGLTYEGWLSEEASRYLYDELFDRAKLSESASIVIKQTVLENFQFQKLLERLREVYNESDPERSQQEYVLLRQFLIENPQTTSQKLRRTFSKTRYISIEEVGELYEDWSEDMPCWNCDRCGPLIEKYGQLRGIKPSACNDHRKDLPYVQRVVWKQGLRRIKFGIHWRVCLPGIPEIHLYHVLKKLQKEYPDHLCAIHLYPGIDRYDLQLSFGDRSIWAVDIKDYRNPYDLVRKLTPLYMEGDLRYDESFYVIPIYRLQQHEDYIEILRESKDLPNSTHLLSDVAFEERVATKIRHLRQGE